MKLYVFCGEVFDCQFFSHLERIKLVMKTFWSEYFGFSGIGSTVFEKGVKLDNLVQIAHNVEIGENTVIAAQTGIAGSTKIGRDVMIGGQVGINGHITITDGTKIAAQSGVAKSINQPNKIIQGSPSLDIGNFTRSYVLFKNLPKLKQQVENLERKINS